MHKIVSKNVSMKTKTLFHVYLKIPYIVEKEDFSLHVVLNLLSGISNLQEFYVRFYTGFCIM